jgi:threonyl-tRNA synthetase
MDVRRETLGKRVRAGWSLQYNYVLVVGDAEQSDKTVSVRPRGQTEGPVMPLSEFAEKLRSECTIPDA